MGHLPQDNELNETSMIMQVACLQSELPGLVETRFMSYVQNIPEATGKSTALPEITFLYKLTPGLADRSFGLNVARMASLPESAVRKAAVKADEMETAVAAKHGQASLSALKTCCRFKLEYCFTWSHKDCILPLLFQEKLLPCTNLSYLRVLRSLLLEEEEVLSGRILKLDYMQNV